MGHAWSFCNVKMEDCFICKRKFTNLNQHHLLKDCRQHMQNKTQTQTPQPNGLTKRLRDPGQFNDLSKRPTKFSRLQQGGSQNGKAQNKFEMTASMT